MRTNPFLKELMETFLHVGGRRRRADGAGIDFDELGVSEVVELLDRANMEAVVHDFGDRNPEEDPVIHFYEHFLAAYDKKQKVNRGVFYTPRPMVSYIVRSVDDLLRSEFGLTDGLADTTTWGEMTKRHEDLTIPEGTLPEQAFVQILDPATGTGTFLVEAIDLIHKTMAEKWNTQGYGENKIQALWNDYIPKHLLSRLHGYELLTAPYAIAHLKIGLKLYETGYRFGSDERARVYLTNALEPPGDDQLKLDFLPALAHEAEAVNEIKRKQRFTVVIGNPPYSQLSANLKPHHRNLVDPYRFVDGAKIKERGALQLEKNLQEDYVKFIRLAELVIQGAGEGVVGLITNHAYLDNPTLRGLRRSLTNTLPNLWLLDLHGNTRRKERCPLPEPDRNVFDIQQGVAVLIGERRSSASRRGINWGELWGSREAKYDALLSSVCFKLSVRKVEPVPPLFMLIPQDGNARDELLAIGVPLDELFDLYSTGVATARDRFIVHFTCTALRETVSEFVSLPIEDARQRFVLGKDTNDWKVALAQEDLRRVSLNASCEKEYAYRPFDVRWTFYTGRPRGVLCNPRWPVMSQLLAGGNLALCTVKSVETGHDYAHVFVTNLVTDHHCVSMKEVNYMFPAFRLPGADAAVGIQRSIFSGRQEKAEGNISARFWSVLEENLGREFTAELQKSGIGGAEAVFAYVYAVLHSPSYRARYGNLLRKEFARIPVPSDSALFYQLAAFGKELVSVHLPGLPEVDHFITTYAGRKNPEVGRVGWSNDTVWLDAGKTKARERHRATMPGTIGFKGVPEEVWDFHIGGYQVCHKWLKDRKGRTLSDEDVAHYQKIVVALNETIRIMAEIDGVIDAHGGWPDAFHKASEPAERPALLVAAESSPPYVVSTTEPQPIYTRSSPHIERTLRSNRIAMPRNRRFTDLDQEGKLCAIWCVLHGEGTLAQDDATVKLCATRLRHSGWANYQRLNPRSDLYREIEETLKRATRQGNGWLDKPANLHVRAYRRFLEMHEEDWRDCVVKVLSRYDGAVERYVVIRDVFDEARERFGIKRENLVGSVEEPIRSAINSCIRRGYIRREGPERLALLARYDDLN